VHFVSRAGVLTAFGLTALTLVACSSSGGGSSSGTSSALGGASAPASAASGGGSLSLSNVTVIGNYGNGFGPVWVAQKEGYFKANGLTVTFKPLNTGDASAQVAALVGGSGQFLAGATAPTGLAVSSGAQIKGVLNMAVAPDQQIAMSNKAMTAHNIPTAGSTQAETEAQLRALKGSKVKIATTAKSGNAYEDLINVMKQYGLTSDDVTIVVESSSSVEISALKAGKVDGIVNSPPVTTQSDTTLIRLANVPPIKTSFWDVMEASDQIIQQHPDTVQAFLNAVWKGVEWMKTHTGEPLTNELAEMFKDYGITDTSTIAQLAAEQAAHLAAAPAVPESQYNAAVQINNYSNPSSLWTAPFSTWADNTFADKVPA
jgi:NitT/TauT family transport system substrate-binding protein